MAYSQPVAERQVKLELWMPAAPLALRIQFSGRETVTISRTAAIAVTNLPLRNAIQDL
jgi:hypothetical protein